MTFKHLYSLILFISISLFANDRVSPKRIEDAIPNLIDCQSEKGTSAWMHIYKPAKNHKYEVYLSVNGEAHRGVLGSSGMFGKNNYSLEYTTPGPKKRPRFYASFDEVFLGAQGVAKYTFVKPQPMPRPGEQFTSGEFISIEFACKISR